MTSADGDFSGFEVDFRDKTIRVTPAPNVIIDKSSLENWTAFKQWKCTLEDMVTLQHTQQDQAGASHEDPWEFRSLEILSVYWSASHITLMIMRPHITRAKAPNTLPAVTLLWGDNVALLMVLSLEDSWDEKLVVMTEQPHVSAGSLGFREIVTEMLDEQIEVMGATRRGVEARIEQLVSQPNLIDLTDLASRDSQLRNTKLNYPKPGLCDGHISIFLWEMVLNREEIDYLRGRMISHRIWGREPRLRLVDYEDLWREGARDVRTLAAWAIYEGLSRSGILQEEMEKRALARGLN
ncbi:hypothetical protein VPNG_10388 [Cytospora leucostoma]|uniref:Uncharacterized protein n=1 Tax=Cytospora leucostoma TaxID=1230097 RepID=A0A423V9P2_9PEZI|nr:hypothetical protein VPNG_10388 [Cytospora leucostoma]